jgi:glycerol-3-phosphate acyltransferase PlsX
MATRSHSSKPTVVLDTYGGAAAPGAIVTAAARMARHGVARVLLVGDVAAMQDQLSLIPYDPMTLRLVPAPATYPRRPGDTLAQAEAARVALPIAMALLQDGEADALVTASPPELVFHLAELHLPLLPDVKSMAAATVFPTVPRSSGGDPLALLLDVSGLRVKSADDLVAFAVLGSTYARVVTGVREPSVALLSTGTHPDDGPPEVVQAHKRLRTMQGLKFVGNIKATDISRGFADVVVADGLLGHTVRGLLEGLTTMTVEAARYAWKTKVSWRVGLRLLSQGVGMLRKVSEFQEYGGAPTLGLQHLVLCASPDSKTVAFENAIKLAARCHGRHLQRELAHAMAALETLVEVPRA